MHRIGMKFIAVFAFPLVWSHARAAEDTNEDIHSANSPDHAYFASARRVPDDTLINRVDLDGTRIVIMRQERPPGEEAHLKDVYARHNIPRRLICHLEWSPDSKFLVFSTSSSGGHSPWHFNTYLFCIADKTFRSLDSAVGSITSADFKFEGSDMIVVVVARGERRENVKVSLSKIEQEATPIE